MTSVYKTLQSSIKSLEKAPRELYLNYILKFCESYNYFAISQILVIFLHNEFQFTDLQAGTTYGLWGTAITFWGLCCATFNDRLGVRNSLLVGFSLSAISTFSMALVTSKSVMQFILYVALPLGNCMGMPMLTVGIRRYTTTLNRGFAFGLFYSVMNIGAFVSGPIIDILNIHVAGNNSGNDSNGNSNNNTNTSGDNTGGTTYTGSGSNNSYGTVSMCGMQLSGNRLVILTATLSSCISFFITLFFLREIRVNEVDDENDDDDIDGSGNKNGSDEASVHSHGRGKGNENKSSVIDIDTEEESSQINAVTASSSSSSSSSALRCRRHPQHPTHQLISTNNSSSQYVNVDAEDDMIDIKSPVKLQTDDSKYDISDSKYDDKSFLSLSKTESMLTDSSINCNNHNSSSNYHNNSYEDNNGIYSKVLLSDKDIIYNPIIKDNNHSNNVINTTAAAMNNQNHEIYNETEEYQIDNNNALYHGTHHSDSFSTTSSSTQLLNTHQISSSSSSAITTTSRNDNQYINEHHNSTIADNNYINSHTITDIESDHQNSILLPAITAATDNDNNNNNNNNNAHQWKMIQELCSSLTFWRFVGFTLLLINLKAVFRHLDATLPTYLVRTFGPNVPKGTIYSINPFMIMFLTPVVSALTTQYAHYDMIKYGGYLTAISPFFLALSESISAAVGMIVVLSLGEAIWSPRTYDYTMSIAPEGREASFSALATAPLFLATVPVGLMSGYLMAEYIPENGQRNSRMMWFIIGCVTMSSPILITLLERYVREPVTSTATTNNSGSSPPINAHDDDDDDDSIIDKELELTADRNATGTT